MSTLSGNSYLDFTSARAVTIEEREPQSSPTRNVVVVARRRASAASLVAMIDGTARHTPAAAEPETEEREDAKNEPDLEAESDADVPHYSPAPQPVAEPSSVGSSRPAPRKLLLDEPPEPGCGGAAPALNDESLEHSPTARPAPAASAAVDRFLNGFVAPLRMVHDPAVEMERERRAESRKRQLQPKPPVEKGVCVECGTAAAALPLPACADRPDVDEHRCVCAACLPVFAQDCSDWPLHAAMLSKRRCPRCVSTQSA